MVFQALPQKPAHNLAHDELLTLTKTLWRKISAGIADPRMNTLMHSNELGKQKKFNMHK